jgi:hypothetical protein
MMGGIADARKSVIRYFCNNFTDGYWEDCENLTLNRVEISLVTNQLAQKEAKCTFVVIAKGS